MLTEVTNGENEGVREVGNVDRPVELYKAIFSDDSDDEGEEASNNQVEDPQKKTEAANTTLDHLIAGDSLEYLGKELGLEVPPDLPVTSNNARTRAPQTDINANSGSTSPFDDMPFGALTAVNGFSRNEGVSQSKPLSRAIVNETRGAGASVLRLLKFPLTRLLQRAGRLKVLHSGTIITSGNERSKKHSRHYHHRSSAINFSDDCGDRYHSHSRDRKKQSSREKSRGREHSKHKRSREDSPVRSSHQKRERNSTESTTEKHKHRGGLMS